MNLNNIITEIEKVDPEVYERLDGRRGAIKSFANISGKIALAALPLALGAMFQKAYGSPQSPQSSITDVLNFALTLEYLEAQFYADGNAVASTLIPNATDRAAIALIGQHEAEHVAFLTSAIQSLGGVPVAKPAFDMTAHGTFPDVFTNYATFLAVAQTFEDTGVRAYKGQAPNLMSNKAVLTYALDIHSVEARHASHVRQMRKNHGFGNLKPWITGEDTGGIGAAVQANYAGEQLTTQAGINIININGFPINADAASEAFDEPLTQAQVITLVTPFFA